MGRHSCSECEKIFETSRPGQVDICDSCAYSLMYGSGEQKVPQRKKPNSPVWLAVFAAFLLALYFIGSWSLDSGPPINCTATTQTVKDLHIVNGKVVEYDKQEVEGCVTDDGYFIPRPDY